MAFSIPAPDSFQKQPCIQRVPRMQACTQIHPTRTQWAATHSDRHALATPGTGYLPGVQYTFCSIFRKALENWGRNTYTSHIFFLNFIETYWISVFKKTHLIVSIRAEVSWLISHSADSWSNSLCNWNGCFYILLTVSCCLQSCWVALGSAAPTHSQPCSQNLPSAGLLCACLENPNCQALNSPPPSHHVTMGPFNSVWEWNAEDKAQTTLIHPEDEIMTQTSRTKNTQDSFLPKQQQTMCTAC